MNWQTAVLTYVVNLYTCNLMDKHFLLFYCRIIPVPGMCINFIELVFIYKCSKCSTCNCGNFFRCYVSFLNVN